jgi:hypothetical protein
MADDTEEALATVGPRLRALRREQGTGEAAEFDTRVPHWFAAAGPEAVELLSLFGPQGERVHDRARPASQKAAGSV